MDCEIPIHEWTNTVQSSLSKHRPVVFPAVCLNRMDSSLMKYPVHPPEIFIAVRIECRTPRVPFTHSQCYTYTGAHMSVSSSNVSSQIAFIVKYILVWCCLMFLLYLVKSSACIGCLLGGRKRGRTRPPVGRSAGAVPPFFGGISAFFILTNSNWALAYTFKIKLPKSEEKLNFWSMWIWVFLLTPLDAFCTDGGTGEAWGP